MGYGLDDRTKGGAGLGAICRAVLIYQGYQTSWLESETDVCK